MVGEKIVCAPPDRRSIAVKLHYGASCDGDIVKLDFVRVFNHISRLPEEITELVHEHI